MLEALSCLSDAQRFMQDVEQDLHALMEEVGMDTPGAQRIGEKIDSGSMKYSKTFKTIKKRLENMMKAERRNYTLSHYSNNPFYTVAEEGQNETIEEDGKVLEVKLDRDAMWNLESKLAAVLKRSVDIYKTNIIDKKPLEKMKVLKYSELLKNSINDLITLGVGMRDQDQSRTSK